jgi:hypothetical protein
MENTGHSSRASHFFDLSPEMPSDCLAFMYVRAIKVAMSDDGHKKESASLRAESEECVRINNNFDQDEDGWRERERDTS